MNLYSKERAEPPPAATAAAEAAAAAAATASEKRKKPVDSVTAEKSILGHEQVKRSTTGLNMLADLIGHTPTSSANDFKLNLFPDTSMAGGGGKGSVASVQTIVIDGDVRGSNRNLIGIMDDLKLDAGGPDEEDDLLGLMDAAST